MIIQEIRRDLKKYLDKKYRDGAERYVKEGIVLYGVRASIVRKMAAKYFAKVRTKGKEEIFRLCEALLKSDYNEEKTIAFSWAFRIKKQYAPSDFYDFERWLKKYVLNWGQCDDFCRHAFGELIDQFPQFLPEVKNWTKSKNRWLRRAAAVIMIYPIRKRKYLNTIFEIADRLLLDDDYLVQKGYGWMLKDASIFYPQEVINYVMKNKTKMSRTALRYAIERYSPALKKKAMSKD